MSPELAFVGFLVLSIVVAAVALAWDAAKRWRERRDRRRGGMP